MSKRSFGPFASLSDHISRSLSLVVALALILTPTRMTRADVTFNDGAVHTINNAVDGTVYVGPIAATTVNVVSNGIINANTGAGADGMNISGGVVNVSG